MVVVAVAIAVVERNVAVIVVLVFRAITVSDSTVNVAVTFFFGGAVVHVLVMV